MSKSVILNLGHGDLNRGFPRVTAQLWAAGHLYPEQFIGSLPAIPELEELFRDWQTIYLNLCSRCTPLSPSRQAELEDDELEIEEGAITNVSVISFDELSQKLEQSINKWFQSQEFLNIEQQLQASLDVNEEIRVIIEVNEVSLRRLPWHCWDFFRAYPKAEMALSRPEFKRQSRLQPIVTKQKVRILAILGNSVGIDLQTEAHLLQSIHDAEVVFLVNPEREEFNKELLNPNGWDILFFAGHSKTEGETGRIYINENKTENSLTIEELETALKGAIAKGLQLAIFNSCDGLGLGLALEKLNIPTVIVMREPIPNLVAQEFFHHFLHAFAVEGQTLYLAVQQARKKLVDLELEFPAASWLPVICQNPAVQPPTWLTLGGMPPCPYRGLFAFHEEDAHLFFGREKFTSQLVKAVNSKKLVTVLAPSGSGKSSAVFAGLIPYLRSYATRESSVKIATFRPGNNPFDALAKALHSLGVSQELSELFHAQLFHAQTQKAQSQSHGFLCNLIENIAQQGQRLVLVADQFEELYTLIPETSRLLFLQELLKAVNDLPNFTLVITLRADFLGRALEDECLGKALQQYPPELLIPMNREELQFAIAKPAQMLGVKLEEGLTENIINDVNQQPGHLSLLQFALTQLWSTQKEGMLSRAAYQEIGGVEKALAKHAEQVYLKLSPAERKGARQIFTQLVQPGEGTEDTRRLATRAEVGEDNWNLVAYLASARLVVTGRDEKTGTEIVEIVHEELIRGWKELKIWMQQDREFRSWQEQLRGTIRTWESSGFDEGALLRGKPLADAEYWQGKRFLELSALEKSFIRLSVELREGESNKNKRTQQFTVLGLSGGLVLALSLASVAGLQWQKARISEINSIRSSAETFLTSHQNFDALITSIRGANRIQQTFGVDTHTRIQLVETLLQAVNFTKENNSLENRIELERDIFSNTVFSPDGSIIATASWDKTVKLWSRDGKNIITLHGHKYGVICVNFSPDGNIIASGSLDGTVKLWSKDGKLLNTLYGHKGGINSISFSPDGKIIATAGSDKTVKLWSRDGKKITTLHGHKDGVFGVSFSPDGNTIATASGDGTVKLWSKEGKELQTLYGHKGGVNSVIFSPDGNTIATAGWDKTIKLWSKEGKQIRSFPAHDDTINKLSFSHDGKIIASASKDKTAKLWSLNGQQLDVLIGHDTVVLSVAFSSDGKQIATASEDKTVKLWNLDSRKTYTLRGHQQLVLSAVFSPDGNTIASASWDNTVKLWSRDGKELRTLRGHTKQVNNVSFSPDGNIIATASEDNTVKLWSLQGHLLKTLRGHNKKAWNVSFSPDGNTIVTASEDKTVKLWSLQGHLLKTLRGHKDGVNSVKFSLDGKTIASASWDKTVKLWSRQDGKELKTLRGHTSGVNSVAFSPDGSIIASASWDNTVRLWNRDGKEIKTLRDHRDVVNSVVFSPDGNIIATASRDKTVKLWNRNGTLLRNLRGHNDSIWSVNFSPDGKTIVTGSGDNTVILWNSYLEDLKPLLARACTQVRDYLQNNPNVNPEDRGLCNRI